MHYRTFNSISGLYLLDASCIRPSCDNQKCLQILPSMPWRTKVPLVETHCSVASTRRQDTVKYHITLSRAYVRFYTIAILQKGKLSLRELSDTMATQWEKPRPVGLQSFCSFHHALNFRFLFQNVQNPGRYHMPDNQFSKSEAKPPAHTSSITEAQGI